jgi:hypothetical protein
MSIPTGAFKYLVLWPLLIASGVGSLACVFAVIASILHFQILWALGFTLLYFAIGKLVWKPVAITINSFL